jgi:hypothetical protein
MIERLLSAYQRAGNWILPMLISGTTDDIVVWTGTADMDTGIVQAL